MIWRNDGMGTIEKQERLYDSEAETWEGNEWKDVSLYIKSL